MPPRTDSRPGRLSGTHDGHTQPLPSQPSKAWSPRLWHLTDSQSHGAHFPKCTVTAGMPELIRHKNKSLHLYR